MMEIRIHYVYTFRLLVGTKTDFKPVMEQERIGVINQNIQKSLHTVYNRLANFKMPTKECVMDASLLFVNYYLVKPLFVIQTDKSRDSRRKTGKGSTTGWLPGPCPDEHSATPKW